MTAKKTHVPVGGTTEIDVDTIPFKAVQVEVVQAAIMDFLEGVADDEGQNAARYFPAVLAARMARCVTDAVNASL